MSINTRALGLLGLILSAAAAGQVIEVLSIKSLATGEPGTPNGQIALAVIECRGILGIDHTYTSGYFLGRMVELQTPANVAVGLTSLVPPYDVLIPAVVAIIPDGDIVGIVVSMPEGKSKITVTQRFPRDTALRQGSAVFQPGVWDALIGFGEGTVLAERQTDHSWVSDSNPANPGELLKVYATELFIQDSSLLLNSGFWGFSLNAPVGVGVEPGACSRRHPTADH